MEIAYLFAVVIIWRYFSAFTFNAYNLKVII